jgi:hypothetical protein
VSHRHLRAHHLHRAAGPAAWLAIVLVLLFIASLTAIALFLHHIVVTLVEMVAAATWI